MAEEETIISIIQKRILQSAELSEMMNRVAELKMQSLKQEQTLTRKQLAQMYQVSEQTIDRLTDDELEDRGFKKIRIGVSVRFERIFNHIKQR